MALSAGLDLRATGALVMTPQLQQAIKLLQMSNQDLCAYVAQQIDQNPFLDYADSMPSTTAEHHDYSDPYDPLRAGRPLEETLSRAPSLREHLLQQIQVDFPDPKDRITAVALAELLDEAGYLPADLDLVRTQLGLAPEAFEAIIQRLQHLDPSGIFARSLQETLAIQLREKNRLDPAMQTLLANLPLLAKNDRAALMRLTGVDGEDLSDMIAEVRALSPKPAIGFAADVASALVPDVLLTALPGGDWQVTLNNETLPRVLVHDSFYAQLSASRTGGAKEEKAFVAENWQQANWLIKALAQRATTILKVATEIVKKQDKFFIYGVQYLKPLVLKDIAEAIGMHESTVSRVTQNKYMATPRGMFELKYFFSQALSSAHGGESVSSEAARDRIRDLIARETPQDVLSDDRLALLLRREGIDIARRTVAKYRESLGLASSAGRRRQKS
ncbi:MAG: RNA polymerase factor sigma-54 [Alphaproteobacteria bacterium]|nr:RNA polymerase factor sigma-54 [Alphaproteobacteria bacterium]